MSYQFARIDLSQTNYKQSVEWKYLLEPDIPALNKMDAVIVVPAPIFVKLDKYKFNILLELHEPRAVILKLTVPET